MMNILYAGWDMLLKRLAAGLHRPRPAGVGQLVSFSLKRRKKLGWNLFLCGRSR